MLFPVGELILALESDLEIESGVRLLGVTDLVSDFLLLYFCETDLISWVPGGGSPSAPPASGRVRSASSQNWVLHAITAGSGGCTVVCRRAR